MEISEAHLSTRPVACTTREAPPRRATPAEVAAALRATPAGEGQWQARCPNHNDKTPSLSVGVGRDGKVLLHCFAGCDPAAVIDALERIHGLTIRSRKSGGSRRTAGKRAGATARESTASKADPATPRPPARGDGKDDAFTPIIPPPPGESWEHSALVGAPRGRFVAGYEYFDAAGRLTGVVRRLEYVDASGKPSKEIRPLRYGAVRGFPDWYPKGWGDGRPLYRLPQILAAPDARALVTEGEKAADAAALLFPDCAVTTPMNGAKSPGKTDWSPLAGRQVVIWPDHDGPGRAFAEKVAELAMNAGAASVRIVRVPADFPPKWDLGDQPPAGADLRALLDAAEPWPSPGAEADSAYPPADRRPCFRVYDDPPSFGGVTERAGVYWHERRGSGDREEMIDTWVCGPLHVEAQTHDDAGNHFGRALRFKTSTDAWREWAMPQRMLAGDTSELRGELLSMGLLVGTSAKQRALFAEYLQLHVPERRIRCVANIGWSGDAFVLPDEVIGPGAGGVVFQGDERISDEYAVAGDLDAWRHGVAGLAVGNPILMLAVSAAFAGPLLQRAAQEAGGIHLVGDSSTGKSTALEMSRSVWGGPAFKRSWRATANGLESVAALHNDCLLPLDELSECASQEVAAVVYMLANGQGKSRANRVGGARIVRRWRTFVLSTGERSLEATLAEAGQRVKAGQEIRLLNVPAQRRYGVFDELHGFDGGRALADAIKRAASERYGAAGRAFLERLTRDPRDFGKLLEEAKGLPLFAGGLSGQEQRAAGRFALIGLAGELAAEYGLTHWPEGAAFDAAAEGFRLWRDCRGRGDAEPTKILQTLHDFICRHGDSRFSDANVTTPTPLIRDRAGWWRDNAVGEREFLFTPAGLRDATKGFDLKRVLAALREKHVIPPAASDGRSARSEWVPDDAGGGKRRARTYCVNVATLEELVDAD